MHEKGPLTAVLRITSFDCFKKYISPKGVIPKKMKLSVKILGNPVIQNVKPLRVYPHRTSAAAGNAGLW